MRIKRLIQTCLFLLVLSASQSFAQGIIFKVPDGVFAMDWNKSGVKGLLMMEKESPSGVFVASPNPGETMDQFRERVANFIAPMVSDAPKSGGVPFTIKKIKANDGDSGAEGLEYVYSKGDSSVQILFFLRRSNGNEFLYGHFGSRSPKTKDSENWMESGGEIPKLLKKLVKSFREK